MRSLTPGEQGELSPGLMRALHDAGVKPQIVARAHPAAYLVVLWTGRRPIMAVGQTIWWTGAPQDMAKTKAMAVLQHELQHLLDFADGRLSILRYLLWPPNWIYRYALRPEVEWRRLGAEQRASAAEDLWRAQRRGDTMAAAQLARLIPWAEPT